MTGSRKFKLGEAMSIFALSVRDPSGNSPARMRPNRLRFSSTDRVRREQGFPNTLGVTLQSDDCQFSVEGTVVHGSALRLLRVDDIGIEAPLEGTLLFTRNRDVPGVIGQIGTVLGSRNINIATFALGRRERSGSLGSVGASGGAEALAIVRVDGPVPEALLEALRGISAVTFARLVQL